MVAFLKRLIPISWQNQPRRRAVRRHLSHVTAGFESLEDRSLLAAGISTNVNLMKVQESSTVSFSVNWQPTGSGESNTVGMNLRVHYDSSRLQFDSVTNVFQSGLAAQQDTTEFTDRDDGDGATDRVVKLLWIDLSGAWPSLTTDASLVTVHFTPQAGFGSTVINVDATTANDAPIARRTVQVNQVPTLTAPATNNSIARPEFAWTQIGGVDRYDIWIARVSEGTTPYLRTSVSTNSFTPSTDMELDRYRVWVTGVHSDGTLLGWSTATTFSVNTRVAVTGPTGRIATSTPVITWEPVTGAERYDLWVDNVTTGERQFIREQNITAPQFPVSNSLPMGTYRVWVRALNASSQSGSWSTAISFFVAAPPVLIAPLNPTFETRPVFSWAAISGAVRYDLWVRNVSTGQDQVIRETNLTTNSFQSDSGLPGGNYVWWVRAFSSTGLGTSWTRGDFSVGGRPILIGPAGNVSSQNLTFQWSTVTGTAKYDLWVNQLNGTAQIVRETELTSPNFTLPEILPSGSYRFWVRAISNSGAISTWSVPMDFAIS